MDITKIEITSSSYKTTNPPISERSSTYVSVSPIGAELVFEGSCNSAEYCKRYMLQPEQFAQVAQLFEELKILDALLAKMQQQPQPQMFMAGGSQAGSVSVSANGVTVTADSQGINVAPLVAKMRELQQQCGEPYVNTSSGAAPMPGIGVPAAAVGRLCPNCGKPYTSDAFCTECGTKLSSGQ